MTRFWRRRRGQATNCLTEGCVVRDGWQTFGVLTSQLMTFPRRQFLGSSLVVLGSTPMDALTTPLWRWKSAPLIATASNANAPTSTVQFVDVAHEAGLVAPNVWEAIDHKKYYRSQGQRPGVF